MSDSNEIFEFKLAQLAESVERLEASIEGLSATMAKMSSTVTALDNFAVAWTRATGGILVLRGLIVVLVWLGGAAIAITGGVAAARQIYDYFR